MVCLTNGPRSRTVTFSDLGTSPDPARGRPAMLSTAVSGTVCHSSGGGTKVNSTARGVRSPVEVGRGGPAPLPVGSGILAASPAVRVAAANPASSPSAANAAGGIGKRSRQDVPAPVPSIQQAADGEGSSRKRPRGMAQDLLPQAAPSSPSARAPPPPPQAATSKSIFHHPLSRQCGAPDSGAAVATPLAGPVSRIGGRKIPAAAIVTPSALPEAKARAGRAGLGPGLTTGPADQLQQLRDLHRGVAQEAGIPAAPAPPVINARGPSGAPPYDGGEPAPLAGAAACPRSLAGRRDVVQATEPVATSATEAAERPQPKSGRTVLQLALAQLGEYMDTEVTRLEGEKAALQAQLEEKTAQEQRLLAQAEQERVTWQQEEARLCREHEAEQAGLQSALDQERVHRVQAEDQLRGARREHEAYVDRVRALVPPR